VSARGSAAAPDATANMAPARAGGFEPSEVAPGLWRWRAPHPEWRPGAPRDSPADWPREVGSLLWRDDDGASVFVDALLPGDREAFWAWADDLLAGADRVLALTTIGFHRRDRELLVERYGATTSRARRSLPRGVESLPLRGAGEVAFWFSGPRALVFGDRVLGAMGGRLRLCPQSWLGYLGSGIGHDELRGLLRPLLELPIERVLVSHGEPVLADGLEALAEALA
jgi:hypothetical protein